MCLYHTLNKSILILNTALFLSLIIIKLYFLNVFFYQYNNI